MFLIKSEEAQSICSPLVLPDTGNLTSGESLPAARSGHVKPADMLFRQGPGSVARPGLTAISADGPALIDEAHAEAARIVAEAEARAAEIEREASERAMLEAQSAARAEAAAEIEPVRMQLAESLAEISRLREQLAASAEHELVQLALEIAKKVVRREVTVDREIVISLVRLALLRFHNRAMATVRLHPDDYRFVMANREALGLENTITLVEDSTISRGGCLVETDIGDVDARIEQQFNEIERGFLDEHGSAARSSAYKIEERVQ